MRHPKRSATFQAHSFALPKQHRIPGELLGPIAHSELMAADEARQIASQILGGTRHANTRRAKPDPQPNQCGAAKLQLAPHDCVVIEDAPNGVRSEKATGARVIAVRTTMPDDEPLQAGADWLVNDCAWVRVTKDETAATLLINQVDDGNVRRIPKMS